MDKRNLFGVLIVLLLTLTIAPAALAGHSDGPSGACPDGFNCVEHVGAAQQIHVHIDNNVSLS